jgi:hypothetical protein
MYIDFIFNSSLVRPTILYASEYWADNRRIEQRMSVAEIKMLRWMSGVTIEQWRNWGSAALRCVGAHGNLGPLVKVDLIPLKKN